MRKHFFIVLIFLSIVSLFSLAQTRSDKKALIKTIDSILQSQVSNSKIPGAVILIKKDNKIIYQQAYGYARIFDRNNQVLTSPEKMTVNHLFDIASVSYTHLKVVMSLPH